MVEMQASTPDTVTIIRARSAGFCPGVQRALHMTEHVLAEGLPLASLGPLIHNAQVVEKLSRSGLRLIDSLDQAEGSALLIRTHGVASSVVAEARACGLTIVDATCPFVQRAHDCARALVEAGYVLCVVGERHHPEVVGITGSVPGECYVLETSDEAEAVPPMSRIGVVAQTTQTVDSYRSIVGLLAARCREILAHNTLCDATEKRQMAARQLAAEADVVVVVGGRHSANTRRLAEICSQGAATYHIETELEIVPEWVAGVRTVGVTAGASTPEEQIAAVEERLVALVRASGRGVELTVERSGEG